MIRVPYDLHIHSCLSPCGDAEMTPNNIAGMAYLGGLRAIALTDHNTGRNVPALMKAAEEYCLLVIPGMELTTSEEVHVVCLFPEIGQLLDFDRLVYERLIKVKNRPEFFGEQIVMNEQDEPVGEEPYLLINATDISFGESLSLVRSFGGLAIPAHLDKATTSLLSNLGFIPPDADFPCAEIKDRSRIDELRAAHPYLRTCRIISDSDAHALTEMRGDECVLHVPTDRDPTAEDVIEYLKTAPL